MFNSSNGNCSSTCTPAGGTHDITIAEGEDTATAQASSADLVGVNAAQIDNQSKCHDLIAKVTYALKDGTPNPVSQFYRVEACTRFDLPKCGALHKVEFAVASAEGVDTTADADVFASDFSTGGTTLEVVQIKLHTAQGSCC